ncbi:hypothetical protein V8E54_010532 [Elaphomyces granulatus]
MAHLDLWTSGRWARLVTDDHESIGNTKIISIISIKSGILLSAHARIFFDKYRIAINPDDEYKITCFTRDPWGFDGRHADLRNESSPPKTSRS